MQRSPPLSPSPAAKGRGQRAAGSGGWQDGGGGEREGEETGGPSVADRTVRRREGWREGGLRSSQCENG